MKEFFENTKLSFKHKKTAIFIAFVVTLLVGLSLIWNYSTEVENITLKYDLDQRSMLDITGVFIEDKIENIASEMLTLYENDVLKNYIKDDDASNRYDLERIFVNYTKNINALTQIRILDEKGYERIRVNRDDNVISVVKKSDLQYKADRYYFENAMKLDRNDIYISDFDLNIENNEIVRPYEPTIRFAIKLYDGDKKSKGLLILNVDGLEFFKVMTAFEKNSSVENDIGVLDSNNFWSLNHEDEIDYEEIVLTISEDRVDSTAYMLNEMIKSANQEIGHVVLENIHYDYQSIEVSNDLGNIVFENKGSKWTIFGSYDMKKVVDRHYFFVKYFYLILILSCLLAAMISYVLMVLFQIKTNNNLLLLASSYISDNSHDGIIILNAQKRILYTNNVFRKIYEYKSSQLINKPIKDIFNTGFEIDSKLNQNNVIWKGNVWNETKSNHLICKNLIVKAIYENSHKVVYYIGIYSNPTLVSRDLENKLNQPYNLLYVSGDEMVTIGEKLNHIYQGQKNYAILTLQLHGNIRKVFDTSQTVHSQFLSMSSESFNNDEVFKLIAVPRTDFMVIGIRNIPQNDMGVYSKDKIISYIKRLEVVFKKIQKQLNLDQLEFNFQVGVALHNLHGHDAKEVLNRSIIALEALIKFKHANYLIYDDKYYDYVKQDLEIRENLKNAFVNEEFYLNYQPQFHVQTSILKGVEVLVRWKNDALGLVAPDLFIPLLENTNDILLLGKYVVKRIIKDFDGLVFSKPLRVSFNLSSKEFLNIIVLEDLIKIIKSNQNPFIRFCIEITETTLIENLDRANEVIDLLHQGAIDIAIDDFGTGYSSLAYLKSLLADELKIDQMFIQNYPETDDGKIVKAIVSMGREMDMKMVVEGVETKAQLEFLQGIGCSVYQGYYGAKPMSFEAFKFQYLKDKFLDY